MGPSPKELDSYKELIQFDHEYYRSVPQSKLVPQIQAASIPAIRIKKDSIDSDKIVSKRVQKLTDDGCKNVKIIITSDSGSLKNGKIGGSSVADQKVLTIPNVILDTKALQKVSNLRNIETVSQPTAGDIQSEAPKDSVYSIPDNTESEDLMDLNFDLLEDLENIINADFEGLTSSDADSLLSCDQDNFIEDTSSENIKHLKGCKRKLSDIDVNSNIDLTASVPSPSKSLSSFTDSDYMSDTPSPYHSEGIASPLRETDSSSLAENLWEESFTELFPDLL